MSNEQDFGSYIDELIAAASASIDSAMMSDEFMERVDEELGDIDNLARAQNPAEKNGDTPDVT